MKKPVKAIPITLDDIVNSNVTNAVFKEFVTPVKATAITRTGTLIQDSSGRYFLVPPGDWFRSDFYLKGLPQVDDFNALQDYGLTEIKDKVARHGQEIRSEDNTSVEKVDKAVATDSKKKKGR